MNTAQIQARKAYLDAEAKSMDAALTEAVESKSYDMLGDLEKRVSQLAADRAELGAGRGHCWWGPCFRVARWRSLV